MSATDPRHEDDDGLTPPGDELLAGEYVLGVLDAAERQIVRARIESDPTFAGLVADWEWRLAPLSVRAQPVAVPPQAWQRIRTRLGWHEGEAVRSGLSQSTRLWQWLAGVAAAIALVAVILDLGLRSTTLPTPGGPSAQWVTVLAHDDGSPAWLAAVDTARGTLQMMPVPVRPDAQGRVPELWLIPAGGTPQPLGLLSVDHSRSIAVPGALRAALTTDAVLAISLEPPGGAPNGAPTGPIIAKGMLRL